MSSLLDRLNSLLALPAAPAEPACDHRPLQDALSGALGEKVVVRPWVDGNLAAVVPARAFIPNGLRMVESAVPGHPAVLAGSANAVAGAERRLAKFCGSGWGARLVDYDPDTDSAIFTLVTHAEVARP